MSESKYVLANSSFVKNLQKQSIGMVAIGAALCAFALATDFNRFLSTYLIGYVMVLGIAVTSIFFTALQYVVRAGWSSSIRRIAELFAGFTPFLIVGMIPFIISVFGHSEHPFYHWTHEIHDQTSLVAGKAGWLNPTFFSIRLVVYCVVWFVLYKVLTSNSLAQDTATDSKPTQRNLNRAAGFIIIYALTITFCGLDLIMSLEPHWFSTMFGVYYFAGNFVSTISLLAIFLVILEKGGHMKGFVTQTHFHDVGKLMFAFTVFWAYISFSQYFLIWYANIPEETKYYISRTKGGWEYLAFASIILHFILPFAVLLRQDVKQKKNVLIGMGIIIIVSNFIDLAWVILPVQSAEFRFGVQELGGPLLWFGLFFFVLARNFQTKPYIAYNDPFIQEAMHLA